MITHKDEIDPPSFEFMGYIETMIRTYNLSERERMTYRLLLAKANTREDVEKIYALIAPNKPIMGLEVIPQDMKEQGEAIRFKMEIEDFKERKK